MALKTAQQQNVSYKLKKVTTGIVMCNYCGGTGNSEEKVYHNQYRKCACPVCGGKGRTPIEHNTEIDLTTALLELGFKLPAANEPSK